MASKHHLIASSRVVGAAVFSAGGERLGRIEDILIDKASGMSAYALMSFDGFLGVGERVYPLPWSILNYNTAQEAYIVPFSRAEIEKTPSISDKEVADEVHWRDALHEFHGAAPYWRFPRAML